MLLFMAYAFAQGVEKAENAPKLIATTHALHPALHMLFALLSGCVCCISHNLGMHVSQDGLGHWCPLRSVMRTGTH